ncbi:hypothetical protein HOF78_02360 [Candidatus Woesearchaeota archaeon]|jgi:hypothetical protein|nr:hypothetical protein [Candidatus Woesearchaeota archaeon]MBT6044886.1 hypothetical protein [Candidatus Woesearchaeota archaeon]MBT6402669.1 hypothetical protein [Candidatus Woesearchaeota archaeon]
MKKIVDDVLKSKKFSRLGKSYIESIVDDIYDSENLSNKKVYKIFLKKVKEFLHKTYSVYQISNASKKDSIMESMINSKSDAELVKLHLEMLHCHSSTRERKEFYEEVYEKIFDKIKKPKRILDMGCGLNAFSLPFIGFENFEYIGMDVGKEDTKLINSYLKLSKKLYNFVGKGIEVNVFDDNYLKKIPRGKFDVCFLFKMADVLDYNGNHKNTEEFVKKVNSKNVIVSFPTRTISNRKMNNPRRKWFELMVRRLKYKFNYFEVENECFYIVKKI